MYREEELKEKEVTKCAGILQQEVEIKPKNQIEVSAPGKRMHH